MSIVKSAAPCLLEGGVTQTIVSLFEINAVT